MKVHFSIDDVWKSFRYIANNRPGSIFDLNLYRKLLEWNKKYDTKVSLYLIACADGFLISELPDKYKDEFKMNSDWLRFGFHSKNTSPFKDEKGYEAGFELVDSLINKMEMGRTDAIRLHSWFCTSEQKEYLRGKGVKEIFYPDDDCFKYGDDDSFIDCGLVHRRTRCWIENMDIIDLKSLYIGKEYISMFTHEWCFDTQIEKIDRMLNIYSKNGYYFV